MIIKPGKYVTRDSRQAVVLEVFDDKAFGRIKCGPRSGDWWGPMDWHDNGFGSFDKSERPEDLIAPWEEPKPRLRVWRANSPKYIKGLTVISEEAPNHPDYPPGEWQPVPELDALFERSEG